MDQKVLVIHKPFSFFRYFQIMKIMLKCFLSIILVGSLIQLASQSDKNVIAEIQAIENDSLKVARWVILASETMNKDNQLALTYIDTAKKLAELHGFEYFKAHVYHELAGYYNGFGNLDTALIYYDSALVIYKALNLPIHVTKTLNNIGLAKISQAKFDEGLDHLFESYDIKEQIKDTLGISFTYNSIGEAYMLKGSYAQAEKYFLRAIKSFERVNRPYFVNMVKLNLAGLLYTKGDYQKSLAPTLESKAYFEAKGHQREMALVNNLLGSIYLSDSLLQKSMSSFLLAKSGLETVGDFYSLVDVYLNISSVASLLGNLDDALGHAMEALNLAQSISADGLTARSMLRISEVYKEKGAYKEALQYREQYEALNATIYNKESEQRIAELEKKYETKLREQELKELKAMNEVNKLRVRKQRNQQYGLMGFAAFSLLISGLVYNQYRTKKKHNDVLTEKNNIIEVSLDEKEILLRETHHRVKNNMQFIASLLNLQSRYVSDEKTLKILNEGKYRINSMALLHQKLYQEENLKGVDMKPYIENLLDSLIHSFRIDRNTIEVRASVQNVVLDIDSATPIGLILNELITNAFKYAFTASNENLLEITLRERGPTLFLRVKDNGPGIPPKYDISKSQQFGFSLIHSLAQKLHANIKMENENGAKIELSIHNYQKT